MKSKPSWTLWSIWLIAYTALDLILAFILHGGFHWSDVPDAVEGAVFAATLTWLFALLKWYKADNGF
jgi:hypothetical protein